ncbi:nuclear transport factor 2 family protein [Luminiphilus syltensis]|nr:nuclear transport factor 2 family protein [Luminiphilus syltensis]
MPITLAQPSKSNIHPLAGLLRGFAVDFLTAHNAETAERIMSPSYRLDIGGVVFDGRDEEYLPATLEQLDQFPGLCVTVHDVVLGEDTIAMCFTEHGASLDDEGKQASWSGITFFYTDGERLLRGWAEEEYISRKRQLFIGECDPVEPPQTSPWDTQPKPANPVAEATARDWILEKRPLKDLPANNRLSPLDPDPTSLLEIRSSRINEIFSAGDRVVLHAQYEGIYVGGFGDLSPLLVGCQALLRFAAILTVRDNTVVAARITTDRLGLSRALRGLS